MSERNRSHPTVAPEVAARVVRTFVGLPIVIVGDVMLDQMGPPVFGPVAQRCAISA